MKVKVRLTVDEYVYLVHYFNGSTYERMNELQALNIRLFITQGLKKMVDYTVFMDRKKCRIFNIEVNQYATLMAYLRDCFDFLDPYTLAIYLTLKNQNNNLLKLTT